MHSTIRVQHFKRYRILSVGLVAGLVILLGLISSSLITQYMVTEARYVRKMEALAKAVGNALQEHIRTNSIYPAQLKDFPFADEKLFGALEVNRADVQKLKYFTDGSTFRLTYETVNFRFVLVGDKVNGVSLFEPTTRKSNS